MELTPDRIDETGVLETCRRCGGAGYTATVTCRECRGEGVVLVRRTTTSAALLETEREAWRRQEAGEEAVPGWLPPRKTEGD